MELLSPAGSLETLKVAVKCGADAVYMGLKQFNARASAVNFDENEVLKGVAYCKERGRKCYITLNTLLKEKEIPALLPVLKELNDLQVDGVIVQDLGIVRLLGKMTPELRVHGSTQMSVHNSAGVKLLEKMGICRVVLSRELPLSEIETIKRETHAELEVFGHGALCVCYSGQCYMSSFIGERSGNRGRCAQPCRLQYHFEGQKPDRHLMSLKDLSLIDQIEAMKRVGVDSLKIEGRLKGEYYVATVTDLYRRAIDGAPITQKDLELLHGVFDRGGYTKGYLMDCKGADMFCHEKKENPYLNLEAKAAEIYRPLLREDDKSLLVKKKVDAQVRLALGRPMSLTFLSEGHRVSVTGEQPAQRAGNAPLHLEKLKNSIGKLGDTPFVLDSFSAELEDQLFLPAKEINLVRRRAVQALTEQMAHKNLWNPYTPQYAKRSAVNPKWILQVRNEEQYRWALQQKAAYIIAPYSVVLSSREHAEDRTILSLPRILFDREIPALCKDLQTLRERGFCKAMASNLSHLELLATFPEICCDMFLNLTNSEAVKQLELFAGKLLFAGLSAELNLRELAEVSSDVPAAIPVYGYLPVMVTENCLKKSAFGHCEKNPLKLIDRKGEGFRVACLPECRNEIFNPHPLFMAGRLKEIKGIEYRILSFTFESSEQCEKMMEMYRADKGSLETFTRGHFYRGVL